MLQDLPVLLRITQITTDDGTILRLAGWLLDHGAEELAVACRNVIWPLSLDLSDLINVDDTGLAAIRELVARGAKLAYVPPLIALLLEDEGPQAPGG